MVLLFFFGFWACKKQEVSAEPEIDTAAPERVSFRDEQSKPSVHISNVFPRQKKMIVDAYQQNIAYYQQFSN